MTPQAAAQRLHRARRDWGLAGARRQALLRAPYAEYEAADRAYKAAAAEAQAAEAAYHTLIGLSA